jgi:hypothetical protein
MTGPDDHLPILGIPFGPPDKPTIEDRYIMAALTGFLAGGAVVKTDDDIARLADMARRIGRATMGVEG